MNNEITAVVADDEPYVRTFMKMLLTDLGIKNIHLVENGLEAVEACRELEPQLLLLDINMNVMNGLEALKRIKETDNQVTVIMMTAVSSRESVEECNRNGASSYILKTQSLDQISERLAEAIDAVGLLA